MATVSVRRVMSSVSQPSRRCARLTAQTIRPRVFDRLKCRARLGSGPTMYGLPRSPVANRQAVGATSAYCDSTVQHQRPRRQILQAVAGKNIVVVTGPLVGQQQLQVGLSQGVRRLFIPNHRAGERRLVVKAPQIDAPRRSSAGAAPSEAQAIG